MTCRGVCRHPEYRFRITFQPGGGRQSLYLCGAKRCTSCSAWLEYDGRFCPCCSKTLRTRPRNSRFRRKWREQILVAVAVRASGSAAAAAATREACA